MAILLYAIALSVVVTTMTPITTGLVYTLCRRSMVGKSFSEYINLPTDRWVVHMRCNDPHTIRRLNTHNMSTDTLMIGGTMGPRRYHRGYYTHNTLMILSFVDTDYGIYVCSNVRGVNCVYVIDPIQLVRNTYRLYITVGTPLFLECKHIDGISERNKPIGWIFIDTNDMLHVAPVTTKASLYIESVQLSNSGRYMCEVGYQVYHMYDIRVIVPKS